MHGSANPVGPVTLFAASHFDLKLVVLLIELVHLDLTLTRAVCVIRLGALRSPVNFTLVLKHRCLLLLPYGDRCRPGDFFDLVYFDIGVGSTQFYCAKLLGEIILGEVGVVFLLPVPISLIPDRSHASCLYHFCDFFYL